MKYDYLIVGSGLFGITFANIAKKNGKNCLIIDKRDHIGGNCYTKNIEGINVHMYGPHIFHTNNKDIWDFANQFADFNNYVTNVKAMNNGKMYSLPFNMNTFYEMWGTVDPQEAQDIINGQKFHGEPTNLEEQALSLVGKDIYEKLIKPYTTKQWGRDPKELPAFIIKRLPVRFTFDNNYYNDRYQGIPIGGYTQMFEKMLDGIEVRLNTDYFSDREYFDSLADKIVYTGCIDEFFDYEFGELEYRSLKFENQILDKENHQGNALVNLCDNSAEYTRCIEHKHFEKSHSKKTVITYEYPAKYKKGMMPYYPVNDEKNQKIFSLYREKSKKIENIIFGGRLAEYKYMDMHVVMASALSKFKFINERDKNYK
jgi:UDP-galactopyranose mutase